METIIATNFYSWLLVSWSSLVWWPSLISCEDVRNWMTIPAVMMGPIPSSIKVPLLEAIMTLLQYTGSSPNNFWIPKRGIWEQTRKTIRVRQVHMILSFRGTIREALCTSGTNFKKGLIKLSKSNDDFFIYKTHVDRFK